MRPQVAGSRLFAFDTQEHARKFIDDFFFAFTFRRPVAPTSSSYAPLTSTTYSSSFTFCYQKKGYACVLECTTSEVDPFDVAGTYPHWDDFWQGIWDRERNPDYKALPVSKYLAEYAQHTAAQYRPSRPSVVEFSYGEAPIGTVTCQSLTPIRVIPVPIPTAGVDDIVNLIEDDDENCLQDNA